MAKKKRTKFSRFFFLSVFLIGLIMLVFGSVGTYNLISNSGSQSFSLIGEEIYMPKYFTGECKPRADNMAQLTISSHNDKGKFYSCTTQEAGKYIPQVNGVQCEYEISDFSLATVYKCDGITSNKADLDSNKCEKVFSIFSSVSDWTPFRVNAGDSIYINTNKVFGDAKLRAKYPSYGLRLRTADGFVQATTNTCEVNSIDRREYHTIDVKNRLEIVPDVPFNAVSGLQKAISTQAVTLNDVESNKEIYITRPGYYYMIKSAEDGFKYVDTAGGEKYSSNIECIPRTTGCSDDAKIIQLEDQSCDAYGGSITNYAPVQGDSTKLCKYSCDGGSLSVTNQCIEVQKSCPSDKPLWDTSTGQCTSVAEPPEEEDVSYLPLAILVAGLVLAGVSRNRMQEEG